MTFILMVVILSIGFVAGIKAEKIRRFNVEALMPDTIPQMRECLKNQARAIKGYQETVSKLNSQIDGLVLQHDIDHDELTDGYGTVIRRIPTDLPEQYVRAGGVIHDVAEDEGVEEPHSPPVPQPWRGFFIEIWEALKRMLWANRIFWFGQPKSAAKTLDYERIAELERSTWVITSAEEIVAAIECPGWPEPSDMAAA